MEKQEKLYQQMEQIYQQREEIYQKREQEIKDALAELRGVEQDIVKQREELKKERDELMREREKLETEKQEVRRKEAEIEEYERGFLQESLEKEELRNQKLAQESEEELTVIRQAREQILSTEIRQPVESKQAAEPEQEAESEKLEEPQPSVEAAQIAESEPPAEPEQEAESEQAAEPEPEQDRGMLGRFADRAKAILPEAIVLERTEDMLCLGIGDKELRILKNNPPVAVIVAKREKTRELLKGIEQFNRMQAEWLFSYEENCLRCTLPFTEATPEDMVLGKCAEAVTNYFK